MLENLKSKEDSILGQDVPLRRAKVRQGFRNSKAGRFRSDSRHWLFFKQKKQQRN